MNGQRYLHMTSNTKQDSIWEIKEAEKETIKDIKNVVKESIYIIKKMKNPPEEILNLLGRPEFILIYNKNKSKKNISITVRNNFYIVNDDDDDDDSKDYPTKWIDTAIDRMKHLIMKED